MRWYRSVDGKRRVTMSISWRLTAEDMAHLLAANWAAEVGTDLPKSEIVRLIRNQLEDDRSAAYYWHERAGDAGDADRRLAWAEAQVEKLERSKTNGK